MTKSLKFKILAVLMTVLLAMGGLFLANTTKVNASVSTTDGSNILNVDSFVVHQGASIRLGDGSADKMGIKFAAELSKEDYKSLKDNFTSVQYGMFIMPKEYETAEGLGPINYENCFGEGSRKYYGPEETAIEGGRMIHNIPTVPKYVEEENGYKGYLVQGSIIKMKDVNLNVQLVGVGYIIAQDANGNKYYAFAENAHDNVRTVVQTAQNLLEKEGFDNEDTTNQIVQGYVRKFLSKYEQDHNNQSFKTSYNAEFYLRKANGDLVPVESKNTVVDVEFPSSDIAKTVTADKAPAQDGYRALTGLNGAFNSEKEFVYNSKLLKVDGSTTLQFIYEEDKGNMIYNSSMVNGSFGWSSPAESVIYDGWSMSGGYGLNLPVEQWLYYGTGLSSTVTKDEGGNHVYGTEIPTKNGGWKLSHLVFPTTVKKFSFWCVNLGTDKVNLNIGFNEADWGTDRVDKKLVSRTIGVSNEPRKVEIEIAATYANGEIGSVNTIRFATDRTGLIIDNFAWEKDLYVEQTLVKADAATTANLGDLKQNLKSTKYTAEELANAEVSNVSAQAISSGTDLEEKVAVDNNDGTYTLTGLEPRGYYEYTFDVAFDGKSAEGKGFVRQTSGLYQIASFDKYTRDNMTWYDGVKGDKYIYDEEYCKNGLLKLETNAGKTIGLITGSVVNFGLVNDYSLRVYAGIPYSSSSLSFVMNYGIKGSSKTAYTFTKAQNMTSVCFFVYNPFGKAINTDNSLLQHSYYASAVNAEGTAVMSSATTSAFGLGELQPGWNYVEHNIVDAYKESKLAANLTGLTTHIRYHTSSSTTVALLFDAYTVR